MRFIMAGHQAIFTRDRRHSQPTFLLPISHLLLVLAGLSMIILAESRNLQEGESNNRTPQNTGGESPTGETNAVNGVDENTPTPSLSTKPRRQRRRYPRCRPHFTTVQRPFYGNGSPFKTDRTDPICFYFIKFCRGMCLSATLSDRLPNVEPITFGFRSKADCCKATGFTYEVIKPLWCIDEDAINLPSKALNVSIPVSCNCVHTEPFYVER